MSNLFTERVLNMTAVTPQPEDYMGEDGLLYCGKCRSKQFIKIFHREDGELESMIQRVYRQIKTVDTDATVTIATSKSQVSAIRNQLGEEVGISVEPCRRDTSPAIALAAAYLKDVQGVGEEESVVVCPVETPMWRTTTLRH